MLIITRRAGERIMVGDDVVVHVLEVAGGSAAPGIEAPRALPVYRDEIWKAVRREMFCSFQTICPRWPEGGQAPVSAGAAAAPAGGRRRRGP